LGSGLETSSWVCNFLSNTELSQFVWRYYINEFEPGYFMPSPHAHPAVEIIFVMDGYGYLKFENDLVKISRHNTLIIPSEKEHQFFVDKNWCCTLINIHVDFSAVAEEHLSGMGAEANFFSEHFSQTQAYLKLTDYDVVESTMKKIVFEMENRQPNSELLVKLYFCELLILLTRLIEENQKKAENPSKKYVEQAVRFIQDSLAQDLTIEIISKEVHISPDYLQHIFKDLTGFSIMEFVTTQRINQSKDLLKSTPKTITEIASFVGISNSQYFCTLFKKYTDMTPRQFRKITQRLNNGNPNIFD
jgi:YesN/AraC family two-component response regulator